MLLYLMSLPERKHPAKGVVDDDRLPTVIFLTVCTAYRRSWLAHQSVHDTLINVWLSATHWEVGPYVLMPDHLHRFAWPRALSTLMDGFDFGNQCSAKRPVTGRCVGRLAAFTIAFAPVKVRRKSVGI